MSAVASLDSNDSLLPPVGLCDHTREGAFEIAQDELDTQLLA